MSTQHYIDPKIIARIRSASPTVTMDVIAEKFAELAADAAQFNAANIAAAITWTKADDEGETYDGKYEPVLILRVQRL